MHATDKHPAASVPTSFGVPRDGTDCKATHLLQKESLGSAARTRRQRQDVAGQQLGAEVSLLPVFVERDRLQADAHPDQPGVPALSPLREDGHLVSWRPASEVTPVQAPLEPAAHPVFVDANGEWAANSTNKSDRPVWSRTALRCARDSAAETRESYMKHICPLCHKVLATHAKYRSHVIYQHPIQVRDNYSLMPAGVCHETCKGAVVAVAS